MTSSISLTLEERKIVTDFIAFIKTTPEYHPSTPDRPAEIVELSDISYEDLITPIKVELKDHLTTLTEHNLKLLTGIIEIGTYPADIPTEHPTQVPSFTSPHEKLLSLKANLIVERLTDGLTRYS